MDGGEFDDLLGEVELLDGSPLEPLIETRVIDSIEKVFERLASTLLHNEDELVLDIRRRPRASTSALFVPKRNDAEPQERRMQQIFFPGKTAEEAWRFTVIIRLLGLVHEALRTGVAMSKRDIYYRDPALFGSQATVDRYVDDIAYTFDVPRSRLNVAAVAKGLIAGAVSFCRRDGSTFTASDEKEGTLVPCLKDLLSVDLSRVRWILVIEKEATFRSIASSRYWDTIAAEGIIMTGKGYPDIATRAMLRFLTSPSPQNGFCSPLVHGLVDFDPDGVAILSVYKYGSIALAHESDDLQVPQISWLGLHQQHLMVGEQNPQKQQGLLGLSTRDKRKAVKMLERTEDIQILSALQRMLLLNTKAELQILDGSPEDLVSMLLESRLGGI